jgi:small subunit ribosomal protein S24e
VAGFELITIQNHNSALLDRQEVGVIFKNAAGRLSRSDAIEIIAKQHNIDKKSVIPISMVCEKGKTDLRALFYLYSNENEASKQLPRYRVLRNLPKDERKKIIAEEKAAKLKAKQAAQSNTRGAKK